MTRRMAGSIGKQAWFAMMFAATAFTAPAVLAQTAPANAAPAPSSEEVIVTASKRVETVKNAPTAITALTSKKLDVLGIKDFNDYLPFVPSLQVASAGAPGQGTMILRGIYSGYEQTTSTVGFYVDDVPFTPSAAGFPGTLVLPDPDLSDVDRIEVLKGPQGTLYGASTLGGLVRVITKQPNLTQFSGDAAIEGDFVEGGGSGGDLRATVNLPIVNDVLALRVTGFDRFDPGYVDNVRTGQDNVNGTRVEGGRATLRYDPTDRLDIAFNVFYQDLHSYGAAGEDLDPTTRQPLEGPYKYAAFFNTSNELRMNIENLTANYRLDFGTVTESASYAQYRDSNRPDYTSIYGPLLGFSGNEAATGNLLPAMNKFTEDLRFNSNRIGPLEFQAGFFYTDENDSYDAILYGVDGVTGAPLPAPFNNLVNAASVSHYDEYAVYGDATYHILDQLDATVGIRESYNVQSGDSPAATGLLSAGSVPEHTHSTASDTSYLFDARWRPTKDLSLYVRAASAYRPGGPQFSPSPGVPASFGPDTVWNYEGGAKGVWLDGRLSADADVYYIDWSNIQLNSLINGFTVTGNGGSAHSAGVEFEGQFIPIEHLVVGGNVAYDQTRIDSLSPNTTAGAVIGDPLPNTPKWSGALTVDYSFPVMMSATGTVGATYKFQGPAASSFSGLNTNIDTTIPAYSTVDLRARLDWKRYSLTFRVDNVGNQYALSNISLLQLIPGDPGDPVYGSGVPIEPRTYRISLEARF